MRDFQSIFRGEEKASMYFNERMLAPPFTAGAFSKKLKCFKTNSGW